MYFVIAIYFASFLLFNHRNPYYVIKIKINQSLVLLTELSSQSLTELFPEYHGFYFPPVRGFKYERNPQLINLRKIVQSNTESKTSSKPETRLSRKPRSKQPRKI